MSSWFLNILILQLHSTHMIDKLKDVGEVGWGGCSQCLFSFIFTAVAVILLFKIRVVMTAVKVLLLEVKQELFTVPWKSNLTKITIMSRIKQTF